MINSKIYRNHAVEFQLIDVNTEQQFLLWYKFPTDIRGDRAIGHVGQIKVLSRMFPEWKDGDSLEPRRLFTPGNRSSEDSRICVTPRTAINPDELLSLFDDCSIGEYLEIQEECCIINSEVCVFNRGSIVGIIGCDIELRDLLLTEKREGDNWSMFRVHRCNNPYTKVKQQVEEQIS